LQIELLVSANHLGVRAPGTAVGAVGSQLEPGYGLALVDDPIVD